MSLPTNCEHRRFSAGCSSHLALVVVGDAITSTDRIDFRWTDFGACAHSLVIDHFTCRVRLWSAVVLIATIWESKFEQRWFVFDAIKFERLLMTYCNAPSNELWSSQIFCRLLLSFHPRCRTCGHHFHKLNWFYVDRLFDIRTQPCHWLLYIQSTVLRNNRG